MPAVPHILVIDDDHAIRDACSDVLEPDGYRITLSKDGQSGLQLIQEHGFDLILLDLKMPGIDGMDVLQKVKADDPDTVVVVITAYGTIEAAVQAMKLGAFDFLTKPFTPDELRMAVNRGLSIRRLTLQNRLLKEEIENTYGPASKAEPILGNSESIVKVRELIKKVGPTDSTILILGETGTGKELVARAIHKYSERQQEPLLIVDCGSLVETLFESELFGHVKGSFTGATATKHGRFELANGGTLFFDEIANISPKIQSKLLRAVQEKEIIRVGSSHPIKVDVRIIAATNKEILEEVRKGAFREDLFYRLSVVPIYLPALRERKSDIRTLCEHFLQKHTRRRKKDVKNVSEEALNALMAYNWPGNVRELESVIERAIVLTENETLQSSDFLFFSQTDKPELLPHSQKYESIETMEKEHVRKILLAMNGHKSKAAEILGIDRKTLRIKMKKYGLNDQES